MRFWIREAAGWVLIVISLWLFFQIYVMLQNKLYWDSGALVLIGIFVFRGGIQLLRTAVAARICMKAEEQLAREPHRPAHPLTPRPLTREGIRR